jgi:hypothetical protein
MFFAYGNHSGIIHHGGKIEGILRSYIVFLYGVANHGTFDEATANQRQLRGNGYTRMWMCRARSYLRRPS